MDNRTADDDDVVSFITSNCHDHQFTMDHFVSVYPVDRWEFEGFFRKEDLMAGWINCHWLTFEPTRDTVHFTLAILYVVLFVVGSTSNALVIYIILSSKKLLTPANIFLVNLAFSDLLIISMIPIFIFNSLLQGPAIGKLGCFAYGLLTGWAGTASITTLTAIAVDRYLVISRPLRVDRKHRRSSSYITCIFIWFYAGLFAGLPLIGVGRYVPEGFLTSCSFDYLTDDWSNRFFILSYFVGAWLLPIIVIIVCYVAIVCAVIRVRKNIASSISSMVHTTRLGAQQQPTIATPQRHRGVNQPNVEMTIAKIVLGLIGTWMIAWTPYAFVSLLGISGHVHLLTPFGSMLPALFAKTASCVDPFIYALNHPKIRKEIFSRLCRRFLSTAETSTTGHRRAAANSFLLPSTAGGADEAVVIVATSSIAGRAGGHPAGGRMVLSRQRSIRRCFAGNSYQEQNLLNVHQPEASFQQRWRSIRMKNPQSPIGRLTMTELSQFSSAESRIVQPSSCSTMMLDGQSMEMTSAISIKGAEPNRRDDKGRLSSSFL